MEPEITVLMPVFNAEEYLEQAIQSILTQTFKDFELLIINDGSVDNSENIIHHFNDRRIRYVKNERNIKLIKTLNRGLQMSKGQFVARMDADDISLPKRLEKQVQYLRNNREVGILGSWAKTIGELDGVMQKPPVNYEEIRASILFAATMIHPTVVFRKEYVEKYNLKYSEDYIHAEDRKMWADSMSHFKITNLPEVLLLYRTHKTNISKIHQKEQFESGNNIANDLLKRIGIAASPYELHVHRCLYQNTEQSKTNYHPEKIENWLKYVLRQNNKYKEFEQKALEKVILDRWFKICLNLTKNDNLSWKRYLKSGLISNGKLRYLNIYRTIFLLFKSLKSSYY